MGKVEFLKDLIKAREQFPFMEFEEVNVKGYPYKLTDDFEVSDDEGNHWGTFRASVYFSNTYPKGMPLLQDLSKAFPWEDDWHTSPSQGLCCVCGVIESETIGYRGISIENFIDSYVKPFYANQLFKQEYGYYKNGEYSHNQEGVWEALEEEFGSMDRVEIQSFLTDSKMKGGRNKLCFCGSGKKIKKCHLPKIKIIDAVVKKHLR